MTDEYSVINELLITF